MKTIILGNAAIRSGNRGCVALSYTCIYLIDNILGCGNYKLYLTDSFQADGQHFISINNKQITYVSIRIPRYDTLRGLISGVLRFRSTLKTLLIFKNADYVLDIGQGDSFADIYGKRRFESIDKIHKLARLLKKTYIFLPQTIGPFYDEHIKAKAVRSIHKASFVMTRDKKSLDYVKDIAPKQDKVYEYIDVAFFLPYKKTEFDREHIHIGLNISALLWHGGYTGDNQFNLKCDYQKTIRNIVDFFLSIPNVTLHFIPHAVGVENDYAVSYDLQQEYHKKQILLAPLFLSPIDAKNYISGMDFFIGARMHATIAAFSSGVPVIPMAYSRKFNGLFIDTLQYNYLVDLKVITDDEILTVIKRSFEKRVQVRELIKERMEGIVMLREKLLLEDLFKILKQNDV